MLTPKETKERERLHRKWATRKATMREMDRCRELDRRAAMEVKHAMPLPAETTASLRRRAREAEERLDWTHAAELYDKAADLYPRHQGQLAATDIATLRRQAQGCRATAVHDSRRSC